MSLKDDRERPTNVVGRSTAVTVSEFVNWADRQADVVAKFVGLDRDSPTLLLAQAVKLSEEVGELHAKILGHIGMQRRDSERSFDIDAVGAEVADVTICAVVLSQLLGLNFEAALVNKLAVVNHRSASPPSDDG